MKNILAILAILAMVSSAISAMGETVKTAKDADDCEDGDQDINVCTKVEDVKGIEIDFKKVNYGSVIPGIESRIIGDDVFKANDGKPTIRNIGTSDVSIKIGAKDLKQGDKNIPPSALSVSMPGLSDVKYNLGSEVTISSLVSNKPYAIDFGINVPTGSKSGNYKGSISITAI